MRATPAQTATSRRSQSGRSEAIPSIAAEDFPFVRYETARFDDLDGTGHVDNAAFSEYIEQAQLAWFGRYCAGGFSPPRLRRKRLPPPESRPWRRATRNRPRMIACV
jgi:hypothetical protein